MLKNDQTPPAPGSAGTPGENAIETARPLVYDLFEPRLPIYWTDFLVSATLGWSAFVAVPGLPLFSPPQIACFVLAALALYRAVIFIHELAHRRKNTFRLFRLVWNLTCGFPLMVPSFTYRGVHTDHHMRTIYGTAKDGEYLPFVARGRRSIVAYLLLTPLLPLLTASRFIVLTPLSYLHHGPRRWLWERASSLAIDLAYRRPAPAPRDDPSWRLQEIACSLYGLTAVGLVVGGVLSPALLLLWYLVACTIFFLNALRTLAAHSYRNPGERRMTPTEQYLDSVNVPGHRVFTALWAPVGLRYHATHHLFPAMPYHALGKAHRRLVKQLPDNRAYLQATRNSLWHALKRLWDEAGQAF